MVDGRRGRVSPQEMGEGLCINNEQFTGPFFISFKLQEALLNNTPIKTNARSCTILPNFVGYVFLVQLFGSIGLADNVGAFSKGPIFGAQRQRVPTRGSHAGDGRTQVRGVFAYKEEVYIQVSALSYMPQSLSAETTFFACRSTKNK